MELLEVPLAYFSGIGLSSTLLPGVLWAKLEEQETEKITKEMLADAERLAGHPPVVLPNGFNEKTTPTSITFMADLYAEQNVLAVACAYQKATDFHLKHPKL